MKERIIMQYYVSDNCTYSIRYTEPMFADRSTVEEEFMLLAHEAKEAKKSEFTFANIEFEVSSFFEYERSEKHNPRYIEPEFFTVDQFFMWVVHE